MRKLDLSESVGTLIALAAKSQERLAEIEMKKQLGLTPAQWKVILVLNMMDGLTQREIAEKINIDGSTLVPVIDKMEQGGLVERKADTTRRGDRWPRACWRPRRRTPWWMRSCGANTAGVRATGTEGCLQTRKAKPLSIARHKAWSSWRPAQLL